MSGASIHSMGEPAGHRCETPPTGLPGQEWICPVDGLQWVAIEDDTYEDGLAITWIVDEWADES